MNQVLEERNSEQEARQYHVPHSNAMATNHFNVQQPCTENRDRNRVGGRVYMSEAPKQLISLRKGQKIFNAFSAVRNHCHCSTSAKLVWQQLNCYVSIQGGRKCGESFSASTHRLVLGYAWLTTQRSLNGSFR